MGSLKIIALGAVLLGPAAPLAVATSQGDVVRVAEFAKPEGSGALTTADSHRPEGPGAVTTADYRKPEGSGNVTSA